MFIGESNKMHIVCCIKQVPDTTQVQIDPETNTLIRAGIPSICNPYDLVAVEAAVQLTEKYGGKVTVVSMGPSQTETSLRECLSLGAHEAILLSDKAFAGADTLATSYTLAQAISKISAAEPVQLIVCGKQAIDGDTAQTGPGIATRLNYTQFTYVSEVINVNDNTIKVKREIEGGTEIIEGQLPALLTVELEITTPRYASLPELVRSLRQEIKVWGANDIEAPLQKLGLKGSPTQVRKIFAPSARSGGMVFDAKEDKKKVTDDFLDTIFKKDEKLLQELMNKGAE